MNSLRSEERGRWAGLWRQGDGVSSGSMTRRVFRMAAVVSAAFALAACSSGEGPSSSAPGGNSEATKTPLQILKDAEQATGGASSVHISGRGTTGGTPVQLDIVDGQGRGGGTITENGMSFQTVLDGKTVYLKADAATWTKAANATAAKLLADKWIKTTTDNQDFSDLAGILDISQFVSSLNQSGNLTKGNVTSVDGVPVVPVTDHGSDGGTLYVANKGTPYIIALAGTGSDKGKIYFTQYNTARIPPDPSGAVDLKALEGGGS